MRIALAALLLLSSCSGLIHISKNGLCILITSKDFKKPESWLTITDAQYTPLLPKYPAITKVWEATEVQVLNHVRLDITKLKENGYSNDYSVSPYFTDHSSLNIDEKILFVRLGFYNLTTGKTDSMEKIKHYLYYTPGELMGCNIAFAKPEDHIDHESVDWEYKVLFRSEISSKQDLIDSQARK